MTAHDMTNAGEVQSSTANIDKAQHAGSHIEASQAGQGSPEILARLKSEEVVLVVREPEGYLIYSLTEGPTSDDGNPYSLDVVRYQSPLPDDLSGLLVDRDSLPPSHLRSPRQVHVLVSTHSGLRRSQDFYQHALGPLLKAIGLRPSESESEGYQVTVTQNPNTIRDFARDLGKDATADGKTIILLSGDGGVVDLLNGLDHTSPATTFTSPPTIALLPLGTGNALFHSLHKPHYTSTTTEDSPGPSPLVLSLRTLRKGNPSPLPTFKASFSPGARLVSAPIDHEQTTAKDHEKETPVSHLVGAIVASYGFHASLVWESDTPAYRKHGDKRFGMAAGELLKVAHGYEAVVEVRKDGGGFERVGGAAAEGGNAGGEGRREGKFNYVLTTLVSNLEKTFTISPASRPLDGRLRLVWFGDVGGEKTMEIMMAAYREGEHVQMKEVEYEEVEEVRVTIDEEDARWRKVCVDGSVVEVERGGWMAVRREEKERVRILVWGHGN